MAVNKFLKQVAGVLSEEATVQTSAGAGDSGKLVNLDANGKLDSSFLGDNVGSETVDVTAFEALVAGDIVNIFDDAGTPKARKADASSISTQAMGFVLSAYNANDTAMVYLEGTNNQQSLLSVGVTYFLSETAGDITNTAPTTSGSIIQRVGRAHATDKISFEASQPIILA